MLVRFFGLSMGAVRNFSVRRLPDGIIGMGLLGALGAPVYLAWHCREAMSVLGDLGAIEKP